MPVKFHPVALNLKTRTGGSANQRVQPAQRQTWQGCHHPEMTGLSEPGPWWSGCTGLSQLRSLGNIRTQEPAPVVESSVKEKSTLLEVEPWERTAARHQGPHGLYHTPPHTARMFYSYSMCIIRVAAA